MTKVALTSLGCARNLVDSEIMLDRLLRDGATVFDDIDDVDVVIINTCGFIQEAVEESVDAILQFCGLKKDGRLKKVIAVGCLVQRYGEELVCELPEVDGFVGVNDLRTINRVVKEVLAGKRVVELSGQPCLDDRNGRGVSLTPRHFRYVKICEGCNHACTFCAIPAIKGRLRSRSPDSILAEVRGLIEKGAKEIVLIGQDTAEFGHDRGQPDSLPKLLRSICATDGDFWVRLLYSCPTHFTGQLLETIAREDKICRYVDLPVQHIDPAILKAMGRRETPEDISRLIHKVRQMIPEVSIRTSLIVGFPGEGPSSFPPRREHPPPTCPGKCPKRSSTNASTALCGSSSKSRRKTTGTSSAKDRKCLLTNGANGPSTPAWGEVRETLRKWMGACTSRARQPAPENLLQWNSRGFSNTT